MSVVVGIDSSLTTSGCARVDLGVGESGQVEALRWETWRARAPKPLEETVESTRRRIRIMVREVLALVPDFVTLTVIEGPAFSRLNGKGDERAAVRWFLIDQLLARGPVAVITPGTRALLAAGTGRAPKALVLSRVRAAFPQAHVPDHNVADGVALAAAGAHHLGMPWALTEEQETAFAKVAWPEIEGIAA